MFVLENSIETKVVDYAKDLGIEVTKMNLLGNRFWPDRVLWLPGGKPLLMEFKRPGEYAKGAQGKKIKKLRGLGYHVEVCWDVEEGKRIVSEYLDAARISEKSRKVVARARKRRPVP